MKHPIVRRFTLPNGTSIVSLRESTFQAGLKAANAALKVVAEQEKRALSARLPRIPL